MRNLWRFALQALGSIVAISRDELVIGGKAFYKTRPPSSGGLATTWKLKSVKVLEINRGGAKVEFDNGKTIMAPFGMLEPDEGFLDEHERKEALKKKRIERERLLSEELCAPEGPKKPTLTYSLGEKLAHLDDREPYEEPVASEMERSEALTMLEALRMKDLANTAPPAPRHELFDELAARREQKQASLFELPVLKAKGEPVATAFEAPEAPRPPKTEPKLPSFPLPPPPPPPEPKPAPSATYLPEPPPPPTPLQRMLAKVQAELEQLIESEADLDEQTRNAERELTRMTNLLATLKPQLEGNRSRQKVLAAQERMVLARVQAAEAKPVAPESSIPAREPAKEALSDPRPTQPPAVVKRKPGRPPGSRNKPRNPETLREVYKAAEVASKPAPGAIAGPGPGWLRRRSGESQGAAE